MEKKSNTELLAGWIMNVAVMGLILGLCWYFRSVLVYILAAFVVSLLGHPLMELMRKVKIRGKQLPDALLAVITIIIILTLLSFTVTQIIPVVLHIVRETSIMNAQNVPYNSLLSQVNEAVIGFFPSLGPDFNIVTALLEQIRNVVSVTNVTSFLGSVASVTVA